MAYCRRCGTELPAGARYCPSCGQRTSGDAAQETPAAARTTLPREGETPTEGVAIIALLLNVFLLPGLGSLIANRREGWYQILLAVVGVLLGGFFSVFAFFGAAPWAWGGGFPERAFGGILAGLFLALVGALAGLAAWIWGLITGITLLRESMSRPRPAHEA